MTEPERPKEWINSVWPKLLLVIVATIVMLTSQTNAYQIHFSGLSTFEKVKWFGELALAFVACALVGGFFIALWAFLQQGKEKPTPRRYPPNKRPYRVFSPYSPHGVVVYQHAADGLYDDGIRERLREIFGSNKGAFSLEKLRMYEPVLNIHILSLDYPFLDPAEKDRLFVSTFACVIVIYNHTRDHLDDEAVHEALTRIFETNAFLTLEELKKYEVALSIKIKSVDRTFDFRQGSGSTNTDDVIVGR